MLLRYSPTVITFSIWKGNRPFVSTHHFRKHLETPMSVSSMNKPLSLPIGMPKFLWSAQLPPTLPTCFRVPKYCFPGQYLIIWSWHLQSFHFVVVAYGTFFSAALQCWLHIINPTATGFCRHSRMGVSLLQGWLRLTSYPSDRRFCSAQAWCPFRPGFALSFGVTTVLIISDYLIPSRHQKRHDGVEVDHEAFCSTPGTKLCKINSDINFINKWSA